MGLERATEPSEGGRILSKHQQQRLFEVDSLVQSYGCRLFASAMSAYTTVVSIQYVSVCLSHDSSLKSNGRHAEQQRLSVSFLMSVTVRLLSSWPRELFNSARQSHPVPGSAVLNFDQALGRLKTSLCAAPVQRSERHVLE